VEGLNGRALEGEHRKITPANSHALSLVSFDNGCDNNGLKNAVIGKGEYFQGNLHQ
jgi:hypothetical protein